MDLAPAPLAPDSAAAAAAAANAAAATTGESSDPATGSVSGGDAADVEKKARDPESPESRSNTSSSRKNGRSSDSGHSILRSVNKFAPQFKKTQHRRNASPLNWFPRKKGDTFLMRKIRHLQEIEGMNLSLDETLGKANPHYTRIEREKIAAREAATKAMGARKVAMIEGSWCRILQAARIQNKKAEAELEKAKKYEEETFEAARAMGVMMYDRPDSPRQPWEVESSSAGGRPTHRVTASFETAFEVDKEVAAAVKEAFIWLTTYPAYAHKEEFQNLLRKISENPDSETGRQIKDESEFDSISGLGPEYNHTDFSDDNAEGKHEIELKQELQDLLPRTAENLDVEINREISEVSENDLFSGSRPELRHADFTDSVNKHDIELKHDNSRFAKHSISFYRNSKSFQELVSKMLDRLKGLQEDELASLATIVATYGLNAALLEVENVRDHVCEPVMNCRLDTTSQETETRRNSLCKRFFDGDTEGTENATKLPSLDKFLVKRVSRLEKEVQEARLNSKKNNAVLDHPESSVVTKEQIAEKHLIGKDSGIELPSLDKILVKHVSKLEREVQEARNSRNRKSILAHPKHSEASKERPAEKPPVCSSSSSSTSMEPASELGSILVKPASKLEREIQDSKNYQRNNSVANTGSSIQTENASVTTETEPSPTQNLGGLHLIHSSLVEQETDGEIPDKLQQSESKSSKNLRLAENMKSEDLDLDIDTENIDINTRGRSSADAGKMHELDMKQMEHTKKMQVFLQGDGYTVKKNSGMQETDVTSEGLDKFLLKHVSRLQKGRSILRKRVDVVKRDNPIDSTESLGDILVKHQSSLEKAKVAAAQSSEDDIKNVGTLREARERKLQEAWGGLSLEESIQPNISRLELDKAALKMQGLLQKNDYTMKKNTRNQDVDVTALEGLDKILVKHVSRLEKEKLAMRARTDVVQVKKRDHHVDNVESLGDILVKHQPKPEKARVTVSQPFEDSTKHVNPLREARERELQEAWGGLSLGNSVRPHVSRLELEKAAWRKAEEEERKQARLP